ncbi:axial regulator YABBY 5-like isoform X2 [Salvia splendens]|uniref:axial regulator YABBY 5-like isoform X2 n=1 Tax=Salvia splendens TaxID=180675 RepID=UPI001C2570D0|nr:axial regulator YABBY 5-like isoform X2 [Salvia splendens]
MPALESLQEQICYVECCICNIILLVIVPYNSLAMVVTINCGHCDNIFSLNMLHLFPSINQHRKLVADEEEDDDDNDDEDRDYHRKRRSAVRLHTIASSSMKSRGSRLSIPTSLTRKLLVQLPKIWHIAHKESIEMDKSVLVMKETQITMVMQSIAHHEVHFLGNAFHETKALNHNTFLLKGSISRATPFKKRELQVLVKGLDEN